MVKYIKYKDYTHTLYPDRCVKVNFNFDINNPSFTVYYSYKVKTVEQMKNALESIHKDNSYAELMSTYGYNRGLKSELRKWKAHNILHKLHIKPEKTKHTNFAKNESKFRRFCYCILSGMYWMFK